MRRRVPEFRRPVRRRFSGWIWAVLLLFVVVGLVLFVIHHYHQERFQRPTHSMYETSEELPHSSVNITEELLGTTSIAQQLVDQMTLAKAYLVIAKERGNLQFAWELSAQIRNCQRLLSHAATHAESIVLEEARPIVSRLSSLIYKAQDLHYDISTTIVTLKKHTEALEERLNAATVQSAEFGQIATEATPKSHNCLSIKLTVDWDSKPMLRKLDQELKNSPRLVDNNLYHFCIFSDNVLATSVVVNSTVSNADHPQQFVFHVVTNGVTYRAMRAWFLMNDFKGSLIEIRNVDEFSWLNASYSPVVKQMQDLGRALYFGSSSKDQFQEAIIRNWKHTDLLNHLRFYVPEMLPSLEKVVFLDDDVVVQKDLTPLFSLDLHGNVNGAVETCLEAFHRYYKYLNFSSPLISSKFDPQACSWAFGMNIFDLMTWKKVNATAKYHYWQEQNINNTLWASGTLAPGLLTFYGLTEPLDRRWHVLGLGYDFDIDDRLIESAAVLHFNGYMKPWMKLSITRYKHLWERYVNTTHPHLQSCFVH